MDQVECRSDSRYAERPTALYWQGQRLEVIEVYAGWRSPQGLHFQTRVTSGECFELCYDEYTDAWKIWKI